MKLGGPPKALDKYQASLNIAEELRRCAIVTADYARDLCVSYWKMAQINEELDNSSAQDWWLKCYEALNNMKRSGIFVSQEVEKYFKYLQEKVKCAKP
jgi:hypothetical protein